MSKIKSFSVGNGDMFYIYHDSENFSIIDCCYEDEESFDKNIAEIKRLSESKDITRFISTHPDDDHIRGIKKLFDAVDIPYFYVVQNKATKKVKTESFEYYRELRDGDKAYYVFKNCFRKWMNESNEERGSSGIDFLWPNLKNEFFKEVLEKVEKGEQPNNISPIFIYSLKNGVKAMWMGDIESCFLDKVENDIDWREVDILFAPHHGRDTGKPNQEILKKVNPKLVVIGEADSEFLNYYSGYNTITQNSAKDILFDCGNGYIDIYVKSASYKTTISNMKNRNKPSMDGLHYLGSLDI